MGMGRGEAGVGRVVVGGSERREGWMEEEEEVNRGSQLPYSTICMH